MIDQIEIVSASIISFSLLVLLIGIFWSPIAAGICAKIGSSKKMSVRDVANAGGLHSVLFFFPWIYLLLHNLNRSIPDRVIVGVYVVLYLACLLGPILFNVLVAFEIYELHSNYPGGEGYADPFNHAPSFWTGALFGWPLMMFSSGAFFTFESAVFWIASLSTASMGFLFLWARSLNGLYRTHLAVRERGHKTDSKRSRLPDARYLAPFRMAAWILGLWLLSMVALVIIGIGVFDDCTLACTT